MEVSVASTRAGVAFISTSFWTDPLACALRSSAAPSQNCVTLKTALRTVGARRAPFCQRWPIEVGPGSAPPAARLWQLLQLMIWLAERRVSKKSILPSSIFSEVTALPLMEGTTDGIGLKVARARCINASAEAGDTVNAT